MGNFGDWNKSMPSGTSEIRHGDDRLRSDKSILEATLAEEHFFASASSTSAGIHQLGSARPFVGLRSSISTSGDLGRLSWATDSKSLHYTGQDSLDTITTAQAACRSMLSGTSTLILNVDAPVSWDSEVFDFGSLISGTTTTIRVPTGHLGPWWLGCSVDFIFNSSHEVSLRKNGTTTLARSVTTSSWADDGFGFIILTTGNPSINLSTIDLAVAGDYYEVLVKSEGTASATTLGAQSWFGAYRL